MSKEVEISETSFREQLGTIMKMEPIKITFIDERAPLLGYLKFVGLDFVAVGKDKTYDTLIPLSRIALVEFIEPSEMTSSSVI